MTAPNIVAAAGTTLKLATTEIQFVKNIKIGDATVTVKELNPLSSTVATHKATFTDYGVCTFDIEGFDPDETTHAAVAALIGSRASSSWTVTFTDSTPATVVFTGTLVKFAVDVAGNTDVLTASGEIKINGTPTKYYIT